MIVRNNRHYYGLHLVDTAVTDITPKSPDYLRITELPFQLTSGRNLIKLYGNGQVFAANTILYVEVLDSEGKVIYSEIPEYVDSGKRRLLIINVTDDVAPGPALITVLSTLKDALVPAGYRGRVNFKWQTQINVVKYESNTTEIIYQTPPEVLLQTRIRPFVSTSFRNGEETSTREYGDYEFLDYSFDDYIGDSDDSSGFYQKQDAFKRLTSFTSGSISSFNRNNVFYLKPENYSAKVINKNYPDLMPGQGFFKQFAPNIVTDSGFETGLNSWLPGPGIPGVSAPPFFQIVAGRGVIVEQLGGPGGGFSFVGQTLYTVPGEYYLVAIDSRRAIGSPYYFDIALGYDINQNSGSISEGVRVSIPGLAQTADWETKYAIVRASNGGPYLWLLLLGVAGAQLDNVRVYPLTSLGYDFKHESDTIGGYVKVPRPGISPQFSTDYVITPTYQGSQLISGSTAYTSYIDFILQETDAAVDDRFQYSIIPNSQVLNPNSYTPSLHKIDKFISNPLINRTSIDGIDFNHSYAREYSFDDPTNPISPLTAGTLLGGSDIYGNFYAGGQFGLGGLYKYNTITKQFTSIHNFPGTPGGANPDTKPLFLESPSGPKMYGTTFYGGKFNSGSIYEHNVNTGVTSILHSFGKPSASGYLPAGPLTQASNGLLYGTAFGPYAVGDGLIYTFNTASGVYSIVHRSGSYGYTNLIEHNGELWGASNYGGANAGGSIFRFNISTLEFNTEYSFPLGSGKPTGLVMGDPGVFYGTTYDNSSKIFTYVSGGVGYSTLYTLVAGEGQFNERPPLLDSGYLYGTCWGGGANGVGSVFRYRVSDGDFDVMHSFQANPDGNRPKSSLLRIGNSLYGTTTFGGNNGNGTIFRIDRDGIFRPYVEEESGIIYHRNSIVPYEIPATSNLVLDYPRWTGPVVVGGSDSLYSIIELEIRNLEPLTGDISKVQLYAKPKGVRSEFVDLGVYPTTPVDVLLDNNYVNHVQFIDSPYRLTGYFKPTITKITDATLESSAFEVSTFLRGWVTGSITSSYFDEEEFHTFISLSSTPESNAAPGSALKFVLREVPDKNGLAYAVYASASIPPTGSEADIWQQVSYNLFSAAPFPMGMDLTSSNYYTASSVVPAGPAPMQAQVKNPINLNSVLMYTALVTKTASLNTEDIFAISPDLNSNWDITGSSVSASSFSHPWTFNTKLGWKTDTYFIPKDVAITQSLYPAIFFEYNTLNGLILSNSIDAVTYPQTVEISNISCREVGDRDYIRDKYWKSYTSVYDFGGTLITSASITSNTDILMDSAKLSVVEGETDVSSSRALGYINKNRLVFQTIDAYKFYKQVPYIISFNACSRLDVLNVTDVEERGDPNFNDPIGAGAGSWVDLLGFTTIIEDLGNYKAITFDGDTEAAIQYLSSTYTYSYDHYIEVYTGEFTRDDLSNAVSLTVGWSGVGGTTQTINDIKPFTTYKFKVTAPLGADGPTLQFKSTYLDPNLTIYILGASIKRYNYDFVTRNFISPVTPSNSKLRVFGINSNFGIPFADQLATPEIGEFIGELEHKAEQSLPTIKNFGRVEMEFEAETDGFGYIAFESDLAAEWYISDISVKPKDRVGSTPGVTRLFVKIPNDLVNKPLTFKVEYLNDIDEKAPYNTILNDVVFSNIDEQQSANKNSVNTSGTSTTTNNTNLSGPNTVSAVE